MSATFNENEQKVGHLCGSPLVVKWTDTRLNFTVILLVRQMNSLLTKSTGIAIENCDEHGGERYELDLSDCGGERYKLWKQLMVQTMKREMIEWQR
jgi:hypothetical protein